LRTISIITALLVAVVATACGDDDGGATTTTATEPGTPTTAATAPTVEALDGTLDVTLANWSFSAGAWVVPAGESIVVNLENPSTQPHTWTLLTAGAEWTSSADLDLDEILANSQGIPAGADGTLEFTAPEPGTYQVVCTISGHIGLGMVAELIVEG
jgi:uncharacterized cupredoxin-like copper-binding protein